MVRRHREQGGTSTVNRALVGAGYERVRLWSSYRPGYLSAAVVERVGLSHLHLTNADFDVQTRSRRVHAPGD